MIARFLLFRNLSMAVQYGETTWTLWDRFDFRGTPTLQDLIDSFKDRHGLEIGMVSSGVSMLWSSWLNPKIVRVAACDSSGFPDSLQIINVSRARNGGR